MIQIPFKSVASPLHLGSCFFRVETSVPLHLHSFLLAGSLSICLSLIPLLFHIPYARFTCSLPSCPRPFPSRIGLFDLCHYDPGPLTSACLRHSICLSLRAWLLAFAWRPPLFVQVCILLSVLTNLLPSEIALSLLLI